LSQFERNNKNISEKLLFSTQLKNPINFSDNIQPVSLPSQNQDTEGGTPATVVGWGFSQVNITVRFNVLLSKVNIYSTAQWCCDAISARG